MPSESKSLSPTVYRELSGVLSVDELELLSSGGLEVESADRMRENVIGVLQVPLGIAPGFKVNGRDYLVPLATEERNVVSMAVKGAELTSPTGGFHATSTEPIMIGQIQLLDVPDIDQAIGEIQAHKQEILEVANTQSRTRRAVDVEARALESSFGRMLVVELLVDVRDSMGSNVVDSMCEAVSSLVAELADGYVNMRVVSNLASRRLVAVEARVSREDLGGEAVVDGIVEAYSLALVDPYRAATHNKGIMNGVSSLLLATSNDTRAVEAGAHAYAALGRQYGPLSAWRKDQNRDLVGSLKMPLPVGIIGGAISTHPMARLVLKILGVKTANELAEVAASVGLACNLAALQALVTTGISHPSF